MLSYQHIYHAGNHADVVKHVVLLLVLEALQRKPAPLRAFDAHAGSGLYDLQAAAALQGREWAGGIARILAAGDVPAALAPYVAAVRAHNPQGGLRHYPGSPALLRERLRPDDHLNLLELHPQAVAALQRTYKGDRQVHLAVRDCYADLPALLPPAERRGLVLLDPSYERRDEYGRTVELLRAMHRRWPGGVYVVWYPLLARPDAGRFAQAVARAGLARTWQAEVSVLPPGHAGLRGSGMLVVNLPFGLDEVLRELLPWLWRCLSVGGAGGWSAQWLVGESGA